MLKNDLESVAEAPRQRPEGITETPLTEHRHTFAQYTWVLLEHIHSTFCVGSNNFNSCRITPSMNRMSCVSFTASAMGRTSTMFYIISDMHLVAEVPDSLGQSERVMITQVQAIPSQTPTTRVIHYLSSYCTRRLSDFPPSAIVPTHPGRSSNQASQSCKIIGSA